MVLHSAPFARLPLQGNRKGTGAASIYTELSAVLVQIGDGDNCKIDKDTKYMQHCQSLVHILDDGKLEIVRV